VVSNFKGDGPSVFKGVRNKAMGKEVLDEKDTRSEGTN
jgi:hypothetical protein